MWVYEDIGNVGKSFLCKWLALTMDVILADGKKNDVFFSIATFMETKKVMPKIILLDIPREYENQINYGAIEQIKNGFIFSGKYESRQLIFSIPHVIIFSNFSPAYHLLSMDRWNVIDLNTSGGI